MPSRIEFAQDEMRKKLLYSGSVDGQMNPNFISALEKIPAIYPDIKPEWDAQRKAYGFIQAICLEKGFDPKGIDGQWGANTEYAYNNYVYFLAHGKAPEPWRAEDIVDVNPNNWPRQYTPEFDAFYGPKGSSLVKVTLPYTMRYSWDTNTTFNKFACHAKVKDSMERVLSKVLAHYGIDEISRLRLDHWSGCYNERAIRGGTKWSMHSWGIAVDFDDSRNKLEWGRDKAAFAHPDYNKWWEFWAEEGWVSLGRLRNYDWMHVQAAKL